MALWPWFFECNSQIDVLETERCSWELSNIAFFRLDSLTECKRNALNNKDFRSTQTLFTYINKFEGCQVHYISSLETTLTHFLQDAITLQVLQENPVTRSHQFQGFSIASLELWKRRNRIFFTPQRKIPC